MLPCVSSEETTAFYRATAYATLVELATALDERERIPGLRAELETVTTQLDDDERRRVADDLSSLSRPGSVGASWAELRLAEHQVCGPG